MKRQFPYYSAVPSIELQGGRRPAQDPSREYVEPRVYQAREQSEYEELEQLTVRARGGAQRLAGGRQRQRAGRGGAGRGGEPAVLAVFPPLLTKAHCAGVTGEPCGRNKSNHIYGSVAPA